GAGAGGGCRRLCCVSAAGGWGWLALRDARSRAALGGNRPGGQPFVGNADKRLIGNWVADADAMRRFGAGDPFPGTLEFRANGEFIDGTNVTPILGIGSWRTLRANGNSVVVELNDRDGPFEIDVEVLDNDHLRILPEDGGQFYLKRAGLKK